MLAIRTTLLAFVIIIADQLSKWAVMEHLLRPLYPLDAAPRGLIDWFLEAPERLPYLGREVFAFFNLVVVWNQGVSFGLLSNDADYGPYLLIGLSFVIAIGFAIWMFRTENPIHHLGIGLIIGGALGNVIDRFRFGAVFDILDVHAFGYHWPAFNIADMAITGGAMLMILDLFLNPENHK